MRTPLIIGEKYGRLTVLGERKEGKRWIAKCRCDCGTVWETRSDRLRGGRVKSCGCYKKDLQRTLVIRRNKTHSRSNTRLYAIWNGMLQRCDNPNRVAYKNYGGRGIGVCAEWREFEKFFEWAMLNGYRDDLEIDRINVNGNYEPNNCRWITRAAQAANKRNNFMVEYAGEKMHLAELSRRTKIPYNRLKSRISVYGLSVDEAVRRG